MKWTILKSVASTGEGVTYNAMCLERDGHDYGVTLSDDTPLLRRSGLRALAAGILNKDESVELDGADDFGLDGYIAAEKASRALIGFLRAKA